MRTSWTDPFELVFREELQVGFEVVEAATLGTKHYKVVQQQNGGRGWNGDMEIWTTGNGGMENGGIDNREWGMDDWRMGDGQQGMGERTNEDWGGVGMVKERQPYLVRPRSGGHSE